MAGHALDLRSLEEELKKLGISIVTGQQDTVISIQIRGLAGKALERGLRLTDQLLQEKVKSVLKAHAHPTTKIFTDPTFGPTASDRSGAAAMCKTGLVVPSKGGSPHQVKVLGLLKSEKIRWERPVYASEDDEDHENDDECDEDESYQQHTSLSTERVFAPQAQLFVDGVCSGDVIQGNLGDCWFLSALSVVATRFDILQQTFWHGDKFKANGLFVCRFMKNFVWHYVVIDDQLPVFGFSKTKQGKPYFARCRDPNELWVSLLEKAYAKLHGSYEVLIGGFVDVALNDLTGMCSEQVILKDGYPGFSESPFAPARPTELHGDAFWRKLVRYKESGTLMGCSIQPLPTAGDKAVAAESSAGNGLYFKHAYALVDAATIKTTTHDVVSLVKLRNPWGMGEWTGPWSDTSDERVANQDIIEQFFKVLKRTVGANATKRLFLNVTRTGDLVVDEIAQDEVIDVNTNDGTFFMAFDAWMAYFTHFFAGIDFPDAWHGRRVEGIWTDATCGGNTTRITWSNNPRVALTLETRSRVFVSLSQEDPRGKATAKLVPIGFHICSLVAPVTSSIAGGGGRGSDATVNKLELKEPLGKPDVYYRLYKDKDRIDYQKGIRPEPVPPAIIPGSSIAGVDDDGTPQPAYTFKQAVSVDVTMEPGRYCIVPSMYMRTDKDTGKTNTGSFWISVYADTSAFRLDGSETIAEEEEGDGGDESATTSRTNSSKSLVALSVTRSSSTTDSSSHRALNASVSLPLTTDSASTMATRRKFEDARDELLGLAKTRGIGLRQVKLEFAKSTVLKRVDCRRKLLALGFKTDELSDDKLNVLFSGLDATNSGSVYTDALLQLFEREIEEDQMACDVPDVEDDDVPEKLHQDGVLEISVLAAKDLALDEDGDDAVLLRRHRQNKQHTQHTQHIVDVAAPTFSASALARRQQLVRALCEQHSALAAELLPLLRCSSLLPSDAINALRQQRMTMKSTLPRDAATHSFQYQRTGVTMMTAATAATPVQTFYTLLETMAAAANDTGDAAISTTAHSIDQAAYTSFYDSGRALRGSISSPVGTNRLFESATNAPADNSVLSISAFTPELLHKTERMRTLEHKRRERLVQLQQQKQRALGDSTKTAALPRLLGGRKSGSRFTSCVDCSARIVATSSRRSDASPSFVCAGSNCTHAFCAPCFALLPTKQRFCEDCFQHERAPLEALGGQLRALLIDKIGASSEQRAARLDAVFASFDTDKSGTLSASEFNTALGQLDIQPPLTIDQRASLLRQFDTNNDNEISRSEFCEWILQDHVWSPSHSVAASFRDQQSDGAGADRVTPAILASVIAPALDAILTAAFDACAFSAATLHWVATRTTTTQPNSVQVSPVAMDASSSAHSNDEHGVIVFMRTMNLALADAGDSSNSSSCSPTTIAANIFAHFDVDQSGCMDVAEFTTLVRSLGLSLNAHDAQLLLQRIASTAPDGAASTATFVAYVEHLLMQQRTHGTSGNDTSCNVQEAATRAQTRSLVDVIVQMDALVAGDAQKREQLCDIVQQLQAHMRGTDVVALCKQLRDAIGMCVSVAQLERLAHAVSFREFHPGPTALATAATPAVHTNQLDGDALLELKSSGDALKCVLFSARSTIVAQLRTFDLEAVCQSVQSFLERQSGASSSENIWQLVFQCTSTDAIDQHVFLDRLVATGYSIGAAGDSTNVDASPLLQRLSTKLHVALALDALRDQTTGVVALRSSSVDLNLFSVLLRLPAIDSIEVCFQQALRTFVRLCDGQQHYLVSVALQPTKHLVVRVREPIVKCQMDFVFAKHEYAHANLLAHFPLVQLDGNRDTSDSNSAMTRERRFVAAPTALATAACYPDVDRAMRALLARLRIRTLTNAAATPTTVAQQHVLTLSLTLVESSAFVAALRALLAQTNVPFFWCVTSTLLAFAIDSAMLEQLGARSFPHVVAQALLRSSSRALVSLLKYTSASLAVRYDVVGRDATVVTTWRDFQAALAGHHDTFAVVQVCPQGDVFTTDVDRTGGSATGAATWTCTKKIALREPASCDARLDRPVVYTDTVKVSAVPGSDTSQAVTFVVDDDAASSRTTTRKSDPTAGSNHFVVLNVRKAHASKRHEAPRLYCTAYDPFTSCEYAVDGCPPQWPVDFFATAASSNSNSTRNSNSNVERTWAALLRTMRLGAPLTPKLLIKVFNRQAKTEKLLGECEVSIGSTIARDGHVVTDWFALQHPLDRTRAAGAVHVSFRFDVQKASALAVALVDDSVAARQRRKRSTFVSVDASAAALTGTNEQAPAASAPALSASDAMNAAETAARLHDLQQSLGATEAAKRDAVEHVRQLRAQLQQASASANAAANNEAARWQTKLEHALSEQRRQQDEHARRVAALETELYAQREREALLPIPPSPSATTAASNLKQASLGANASAHDILAAMKDILGTRCPERPYNGLKKALAAVTEVPGKVAFAAFDDVLSDFGLALSLDHRKTVASMLDPDMRGRVSIEGTSSSLYFFIKLCGDADAYTSIPPSARSRPVVEAPHSPVVMVPTPPTSEAGSPVRSIKKQQQFDATAMTTIGTSSSSTAAVPAPSRARKMNWKEMKKFLLLNLPEGWEARFTEKGRPYFCNHAERSTQWKHPKAEIEVAFKEWLQENGQSFTTTATTTASRRL